MTNFQIKNVQISDSEIVAKFKAENTRTEAFNLLLKKYQQRLYWHIRRMVINHDDTDDLLQEVFIKVWKNFGDFRQDSQIYTWLYRIGTNECITFLNRKKLRPSISMDDEETGEWLVNSLRSERNYDSKKIEWKLQRAILTLPEKQRQVFNMKYFDDLKYEEISEIVGTSVGALKASFHHAVKKIEKFLEEDSAME